MTELPEPTTRVLRLLTSYDNLAQEFDVGDVLSRLSGQGFTAEDFTAVQAYSDELMRATNRIFGGYRAVFGMLAAKMRKPAWTYAQAAKALPPVDQTTIAAIVADLDHA